MNWFGNQSSEGIECSLLAIGIVLTIVNGIVKWPIDNLIY